MFFCQLIIFSFNIDFVKNGEILLIELEWLFLFLLIFIKILLFHKIAFIWPLFILIIIIWLFINNLLLINPNLFDLSLLIIVVFLCVDDIVQVTLYLILLFSHSHLFRFLVKNEIFSAPDLLKHKGRNFALTYHTAIDFYFIVSLIRNFSDQSFTLTRIYFWFFSLNWSEMSNWLSVFIECWN